MITDFLQLLTRKDWNNLFTHAITIGAIVATGIFLDRASTRIHRANELTEWIRKARHEKDSKEHKVLSMTTKVDGSSPGQELLSAKETRERILAKTLDPKENLVFLAKRCRTYSHDIKGVNAIAEEIYDEVRKSDSFFFLVVSLS